MKTGDGDFGKDAGPARLPAVLGLPLVVGLALFARLLCATDGRVLGVPGNDLDGQFVHWRAFGFGHLCHGHLPLWNPHLFSGTPYLATFQSALFYPPNLLFCVLPLDRALNVSLVLHVLTAGATMALWLDRRGLVPLACGVGGVLCMLGGAFFLHVYPGHLSNLCTMAWVPLVFCAVDAIAADGPRVRWVLLGTLAVGVQILAGHPQYVYYAAVVVGLYALVRPLDRPTTRGALLGACAAMYVGGALLSAAQLLPGLAAARAGVRGGSVPYAFAASLPFPPENLATLFAWNVLGPIDAYAGRGLLWESSQFVGAAGVALAAIGWADLDRGWRRAFGGLLAATFVLALGDRTPLFGILYRALPGFGAFRGTTKFGFLLALFVVVLAATGADAVVRRRYRDRAGLGLVAIGLGTLALVALLGADGKRLDALATRYLRGVAASGETIALAPPPTADATAAVAARAVGRAAAVWSGIGALLLASRWRPAARYLVLAIAVAEVFRFAQHHVPTFPLSAAYPTTLSRFRELASGGDLRVLNAVNPNLAMSWGYFDLWGQDPGVSRRYAEFLQWAHGADPDGATQYLPLTLPRPAIGLLRGRFGVYSTAGDVRRIAVGTALPRLQIVHAFRLLADRDAIFAALAAPEFDPTREAVLEVAPGPLPEPATGPESAEVVGETTDDLDVDVTLSASAILIVSDAYDPDWRARLVGAHPGEVPVVAADRVLRAVALPAGRHRVRLEYRPVAVVAGAWTSIATLVAGLGWCLARLAASIP